MHFETRGFLAFTLVLCLGTFFLCSNGFAPRHAISAESIVTDVRVGKDGRTTRLVLDLTHKIAFKVFALSKPYRIVIDLPEGISFEAAIDLLTAFPIDCSQDCGFLIPSPIIDSYFLISFTRSFISLGSADNW